MPQYAAKLLFQFRPSRRPQSSERVLCEERIVTFSARSPRAALSKAKRLARKGSHTFPVVGGGRVHFEPVGIMELMELGVETEPGEVWWDIYERKLSSARTRLIPPERSLRIFTDLGSRNGNSKRRKRRRLTRA